MPETGNACKAEKSGSTIISFVPETPLSDMIVNLWQSEIGVKPNLCLERQKLIKPGNRAKMVDWMIEVTKAFGCSTQTFFLAVDIMDRYFYSKEEVEYSPDAHELTP